MEGSKINSILTLEYVCNEKENQFFDRKSAKKIRKRNVKSYFGVCKC